MSAYRVYAGGELWLSVDWMALWSRLDSVPFRMIKSPNQDNRILGVSNPWLDYLSMGSKKSNLDLSFNILINWFLSIYQPRCISVQCISIFLPIRVWQRVPTTRMRIGKLQSVVLWAKCHKIESSGNVFSSFASWWTTKLESPTCQAFMSPKWL